MNKFKRNKLLTMSDFELDKAIKITGTNFDRRVKLSVNERMEMKKLYSKGFTVKELAIMFNVDQSTVKYSCDDEYRKQSNERRARNAHKVSHSDNHLDRYEYKRLLVKGNLI